MKRTLIILILISIATLLPATTQEKDQMQIDELQGKYETWSSLEMTTPEANELLISLVSNLKILSSKNGAEYPVLKAGYLLGMIYYTQKEMSSALESFVMVADKGKETYLASLALSNAAAVCENMGEREKAFGFYRMVYERYGNNSAEAPKALFGLARLSEANNNTEQAKAIFQQLVDEFPTSEFAKLACSRLVMLR